MKIAFWSNDRGTGVTANLAAFCMAGLHEHQRKTFILENHYNSNNLAKYLIPSRMEYMKEVEVYYLGHGTRDCLVQQLERGTNKKRAELSTIELLQDKLLYLPQNRLLDDFFDYEFQWNQLPLLERFEERGHLILIDTKPNNSLSSKMILDDADLIVVNLKQDLKQIEDFFHQYSSMLEKAFFILSDYRANRGITQQQIRKQFEIKSNRLAIIPHNIEFASALYEGRTVEFINRNIHCDATNPNYYFMEELMKTTKKIMKVSTCENHRMEVIT